MEAIITVVAEVVMGGVDWVRGKLRRNKHGDAGDLEPLMKGVDKISGNDSAK